MRDKEPPAAEVAPREQLRAPCSPSPHSALSLHPTTWSDRGAFKTLLAAHAQLFVCSWEFLRKKKKKKKKRAGDPGSAGAGASLLQPAEYKAAFLPRPRGRSGFLLRGLRGAGHTWGRTPSGARRPGGRAGESQVPVRGRARPPRPDRGGGSGHESAYAQGCGDVSPQFGLQPRPQQLCLEDGGKQAAAVSQAGRRTAGYRQPPSPPRVLLLDAPISGAPARPRPPGRASAFGAGRGRGGAVRVPSPFPPGPLPLGSPPERGAPPALRSAPGATVAAGFGSPRTRSGERAAMPECDWRQPTGGRRAWDPPLRTGQRDGGRRR